jgi:hypothetical protein
MKVRAKISARVVDLEMLQQPRVNVSDAPLQESQVTVFIGQVGFDTRNLAGKPLAVLKGNEAIVPAVPELHRDPDGLEFETPGLQVRGAVLPPTLVTRCKTIVHALREVLAKLWGECGRVHR